MNATKRRVGSHPGLADDANVLTTAIRADGRHGHVTVRADRGLPLRRRRRGTRRAS